MGKERPRPQEDAQQRKQGPKAQEPRRRRKKRARGVPQALAIALIVVALHQDRRGSPRRRRDRHGSGRHHAG